ASSDRPGVTPGVWLMAWYCAGMAFRSSSDSVAHASGSRGVGVSPWWISSMYFMAPSSLGDWSPLKTNGEARNRQPAQRVGGFRRWTISHGRDSAYPCGPGAGETQGLGSSDR